MAQRDLISEIEQIRTRRIYNNVDAEFSIRLHQLEGALKSESEIPTELLRYFPIALVAILENFTRHAVKELVDHGDPFLENAKGIRDTRFDFNTVLAIHGQRVTLGDFLGHIISVNNLNDVNSILSILIGKDFLEAIKNVHDRWKVEIQKEPKTPILTDPGKIFAKLQRTFELRHIFCHELASTVINSREEMIDLHSACSNFIDATQQFLSQLRFPNAPLTQFEMNKTSGEEAQAADEMLKSVLEELDKEISVENYRRKQFEQLTEVWLQLRKARAQFEGDRYLGGSLSPYVRNVAYKDFTLQMISELKEILSQARQEG